MVLSMKDKTKQVVNVNDLDSIVFVENDVTSIDSVTVSNKLNGVGDKLKILAIGNSFTEDPGRYLYDILESEKIDPNDLEVYTILAGGTSLEHWNYFLDKGVANPMYKIYGKHSQFMSGENYTLKEALNYDWDIVVLQQLSSSYYDVTTYEPYMTNLLVAIRKYVIGNPRIAWQMVWSRNRQIGESDITGEKGWENNVAATKHVMENYDIDFLVPTGTAIENARRTSLCPPNDYTRDDIHLGFGAGVYMAGLTWYGSLIAPYFNKNIYKVSVNHVALDWEKNFAPHETVDVDDSNRDVFIDCVAKSIVSPYRLSTITTDQSDDNDD